ncbi:MAG: YegS/Rv2252/BmrU family lipid kinase [Oscillospiraceae bacterium]|nr:YegS/Rv2252/BmrU family lipid kinase [Oscillospiraceae bacterium]
MKHIMLIVNPYSGKGKAKELLCDIISQFGAHGYILTVYVTGNGHKSSYFAETYGSEYDIAVCIGGDGTLSDTVNGVMHLPYEKRPCLGYIPMGTANDVATTLRLPSDPTQAVTAVANGSPVALDIGKFGDDLYFTYIAAFGAFTEVSYATPQNMKNSWGHLAYVLGGIVSLPSIKEHHVRIEYDGGTIDDSFIFGGVTNTTSVAVIVKFSPDDVKLGDGLFEVILVKKPVSLADLSKTVSSVLNQNMETDNILMLHTSKIKFTFDEPVKWTRDGEAGGEYTQIEIGNCREAVKVML